MMREAMGHFVSYQLLPIVFNMSLTASVVIVFVLLARLVLNKAPKVYSYALWAVVLFRLLCPVSITSGISLLALTDPPVLETTTQTNYVAYVPPNIVHTEFPQVQLPVPGVSDAINETLPQGQEQLVADPLEFPVALATAIWMLGIMGLLVYSVISLILLRRRLVGAIALRDNIYLADYIDTPFVMGVLRPKIYLPSSLEEQEQEYIILHEQHHIRRLDHIIKMLAFAALCIHWFNPLVWVAFVLSGKDMEMSCDEAVLKKMGEHVRADYSASLLTLATGRRIIAGTPLAFGEGDTKDRIKNLLNWKQPKVWFTFISAIVCVVVIVACGVNPSEIQEPAPHSTPAISIQETSDDILQTEAPFLEESATTRREGVYTFALLGKDKESGSTDTIIVVTYDTVEQTVGMVSVPRDTVVERSWNSNPKINSTYAMAGPDTLKDEIKNTFGIPIDYYVWINLDGFVTMVDLVGGVDVYIPIDMNYDDPYQDLHIHYTEGQHHLNGQQAMEVVRFRHNNKEIGGGYNDEGRAEMQRQVLTALAKKVISLNSIPKINQYMEVFGTYVKTDMSVSDMTWFAMQALKVDISTGLKQGALEGRGDSYYKGYSWCYTFQAEDVLPTLNELLNPYDMDLTVEDLNLPKANGYYFDD